MGVPESIRRVPRPSNTVVCDSGGSTPLRYSVRERKGFAKNTQGKSVPVNGRVIGHIIDGAYVPLAAPRQHRAQFLSYGSAALVHSVTADLKADLLHCFHPAEALDILTIALLRVLSPHSTVERYATEYAYSYVSVWYPDAHLSEDRVTDLLLRLGMNKSRRADFCALRLAHAGEEQHIAIAGTIRQSSSRIHSLGAFSRKARTQGIRKIPILYAFDMETMEPVCADVIQGNCRDVASYSAFIRDNQLSRGIILAGRGLFTSAAAEDVAQQGEEAVQQNEQNEQKGEKEQKGLHYLSPVSPGDPRIVQYDMLRFTEQLYCVEAEVVCKKQQLADGTFLYSFRDNSRFALERKAWLERARALQNFDAEEFRIRAARFGLSVFESDTDLTCSEVWKCSQGRRLLELMLAQFTGDEELAAASVQADLFLQGSEFINFIATIITCRITRKMEEAGLLDKDSYGDVMTDLGCLRRSTSAPDDVLPKRDDRYWEQPSFDDALAMLESLGLCQKPPELLKPRGKPGRPRTKPLPDPEAPKKPRGRPRTKPLPDPEAPKRPRGRPRTRPLPDPDAPKRQPGRPRTKPLPDPEAPKRPRGRPRKTPLPPSEE